MSYLVQSKLAGDATLVRRITACAAVAGIPDPGFWAQSMMWEFSSRPGWVAAYAAASGTPGADESAVTDVMIRDAVEALYVPPVSPEQTPAPVG